MTIGSTSMAITTCPCAVASMIFAGLPVRTNTRLPFAATRRAIRWSCWQRDDTLLPHDVWAPTYEQRLIDLVDVSTRSPRDPSRQTFQRLWVLCIRGRDRMRDGDCCGEE